MTPTSATASGTGAQAASRPNTVVIEDAHVGVRVLTINRPQRRNALDHATYLALATAIRQADDDPSVRVSIITGTGSTFTSGNDIDDFRRVPQPEPRGGPLLLTALIEARKPVLAAVEGHAVGIGVTMLLHCDLVFAGAGAQFRLPFVALGLTPEGASTYLLPRIAGDKRASELLLLGEPFDAADAAAAGLINRVVEQGAALAEAIERASVLASLPAASVEATKALLRKQRSPAMYAALRDEFEVFAERLTSSEARAAFARFASQA